MKAQKTNTLIVFDQPKAIKGLTRESQMSFRDKLSTQMDDTLNVEQPMKNHASRKKNLEARVSNRQESFKKNLKVEDWKTLVEDGVVPKNVNFETTDTSLMEEMLLSFQDGLELLDSQEITETIDDDPMKRENTVVNKNGITPIMDGSVSIPIETIFSSSVNEENSLRKTDEKKDADVGEIQAKGQEVKDRFSANDLSMEKLFSEKAIDISTNEQIDLAFSTLSAEKSNYLLEDLNAPNPFILNKKNVSEVAELLKKPQIDRSKMDELKFGSDVLISSAKTEDTADPISGALVSSLYKETFSMDYQEEESSFEAKSNSDPGTDKISFHSVNKSFIDSPVRTFEEVVTSKLDTQTDSAKLMLEDIRYQVNQSKRQMKIQLKPRELGEMTLDLQLFKGGIVAKFFVENEKAKLLIEQNLPQLKDTFRESGTEIKTVEVYVGNGADFHMNQQNMAHSQHSKQQLNYNRNNRHTNGYFSTELLKEDREESFIRTEGFNVLA